MAEEIKINVDYRCDDRHRLKVELHTLKDRANEHRIILKVLEKEIVNIENQLGYVKEINS